MRKMICRLPALIDAHNLKLSDGGDTSQRLNQRQLSLQTGIAASTLNRLFKNEFNRVDAATVETLCDFFECEVGDLFVLKESGQ